MFTSKIKANKAKEKKKLNTHIVKVNKMSPSVLIMKKNAVYQKYIMSCPKLKSYFSKTILSTTTN